MLTAIQTNRLLLPTCKSIEMINIGDIVRIEAISNYSKLYFADGKTLVVAKVLRWFEEILLAKQFIRVHRAHLVNKQFISRYIKGEGEKIQLTNGECIEVSRRRKSSLVQSLYNRAA
jgi:two-component system, LytTR family, response regulator